MTDDDRRTELDDKMVALMTNHRTILMNQDYIADALGHQHDCIEALKKEVAGYAAILSEVRELLIALHISAGVIKYVAVVGAAVVSAWHGFKAAWAVVIK